MFALLQRHHGLQLKQPARLAQSRHFTSSLLPSKLGPKTVLEVDLRRPIVEKIPTNTNPFHPPLVFGNIITNLYDAAHNPNIVGVSVNLGGKPLGMAHIQELREVIKVFRGRHKATFVHAEAYPNWDYYLASAFEHLWMIPEGVIQIRNVHNIPVPYFGDALSEQGIDISTIRKKDHKLAFDNLTENKMSDNARAQMQRLMVDGFWAQCKRDLVMDNRFKNEEDVQALVDLGFAYGPGLIEKKIVDGLIHSAKAKEEMLRIVGLPEKVISSPKERSKHLINLGTYAKQAKKHHDAQISPPFYKRIFISKPSIVAVITLSGSINSGSSRDGITSQYSEKLIRQAAADKQVKAIVLRIDSGGGSALASSVIGDAIQETIKLGKPVVASMASVAASGGYWIASPCSAVLASPATITGSIGVLIPSIRIHQLLTKKMGINIDYGPGKQTPSSHLDSFIAPYTEQHRQIQDQLAEHFYQRFLIWVSETRKLELSAVEELAQGKVHTGQAAFTLKLVDELGGFIPALKLASKLGGVPLQSNGLPLIKKFPSVSPLQAVLKQLSGKTQPKNSEDLSLVSVEDSVDSLISLFVTSPAYFKALEEVAGTLGLDDDLVKSLVGENDLSSVPTLRQPLPQNVRV